MKVTPQRTLIFEILSGLRTHPSVTAVAREVSLRSPNVSFDTVNRTLQSFVDMGILRKVVGTGNALRFDTNPLPHHHIQCVRCGTIQDIESPDLDSVPVPKFIAGRYKVLSKMMVFEVVCDECARKERIK
ncbi:MAG: transcriptional repressor [Acidobacteria bacterium]|nr:transcriptional repressor [Acidobacteriota bacterium]